MCFEVDELQGRERNTFVPVPKEDEQQETDTPDDDGCKDVGSWPTDGTSFLFADLVTTNF